MLSALASRSARVPGSYQLMWRGSALPILRQLGAQGGGSSLIKSAREGDFSMLKVWVGLEARKFLKASVDDVSAVEFLFVWFVTLGLLIIFCRSNCASSTISCLQISDRDVLISEEGKE